MTIKVKDSTKLLLTIGGIVTIWYGTINLRNNSTKQIETIKIIDTRTEVVNRKGHVTRAFIEIQSSSTSETVTLDDWDRDYSNTMLEKLRNVAGKSQCVKVEIHGKIPEYRMRVISKVEDTKCDDNSH